MNNDTGPTGGDSTDNFIRSNTIKIPAVLALDGTDAIAIVAGMITNPARIPVRIEHGHAGQPGRAAAVDPMRDAQRATPASPAVSGPNDDDSNAALGRGMAPRRRRR